MFKKFVLFTIAVMLSLISVKSFASVTAYRLGAQFTDGSWYYGDPDDVQQYGSTNHYYDCHLPCSSVDGVWGKIKSTSDFDVDDEVFSGWRVIGGDGLWRDVDSITEEHLSGGPYYYKSWDTYGIDNDNICDSSPWTHPYMYITTFSPGYTFYYSSC